ncbi:winged helix-turn-helix transcriptional regulator [Mobilitalea sibirica]|uniref:Winged helix-turn-helix transcriptional regulator n=1 Tax=Mobilitalea sibirica TaxID=1462919 RepID=A0A8J7L315_9FIRM|nr:winged helix-turn-helix domain-containing protein [Mobilitalea sibirica]MBH1941603.1 winged helix-turn-helix transcriptional regulator [Mobilitalea sibirica]
MSIKVNQELDPIFETIMLLYHCYDLEKMKNTVIKELNESGYKGEEFYQKHFKLQEKYYRAFQKNRVTSEWDAFYFKDTSWDFFCSFITPFLIDRNLVNSISELTDAEILSIILQNNDEIFEEDKSDYINLPYEEFIQVDHLISFINHFELTENENWKMLLIMRNLKTYYNNFAEIIKKNIPVYEKSIDAIKSSVDKHVTQYRRKYGTEEKVREFIKQYNLEQCEVLKVMPTLVSATAVIIIANTCYIGFLVDKVMAEGFHNNENEYLLTCLKAMSDNSKMEILTSLKKSPKYATELAAQLGLTTATVSHHMNNLLIAQMVYVEKENGKYYYHINEATVKNLLDRLYDKLLK